MSGFMLGHAMMVDQPSTFSNTYPYAAEAFIEPWLIKHSAIYRKYLVRNGRTVSKAEQRQLDIVKCWEEEKQSMESNRKNMTVQEVEVEGGEELLDMKDALKA